MPTIANLRKGGFPFDSLSPEQSYLWGMRIWMHALLPAMLQGLLACGNHSSATLDPSMTCAHEMAAAAVDTPTQILDSVLADTISKAHLLGRIVPAKDPDFVLIAQKYTVKSGIYLRREAYSAFEKMHAAAAAAGITLTILSATRTFADQKTIWENKWTGRTIVGGKNLGAAVSDPVERAKIILRYSSMPGSSRHHWGTDVDLNSLENSYFLDGVGRRVYAWLQAHAAEFGFCQPYTPIAPDRPGGYQEERWHWSYMPLSMRFLEAYRAKVRLADIHGFLGSETAEPLKILEHYVAGIAPRCKEWK
ncbi:MAG: hypothetical protein RLZZ165_426 [Bacteroidota bacterium]